MADADFATDSIRNLTTTDEKKAVQPSTGSGKWIRHETQLPMEPFG